MEKGHVRSMWRQGAQNSTVCHPDQDMTRIHKELTEPFLKVHSAAVLREHHGVQVCNVWYKKLQNAATPLTHRTLLLIASSDGRTHRWRVAKQQRMPNLISQGDVRKHWVQKQGRRREIIQVHAGRRVSRTDSAATRQRHQKTWRHRVFLVHFWDELDRIGRESDTLDRMVDLRRRASDKDLRDGVEQIYFRGRRRAPMCSDATRLLSQRVCGGVLLAPVVCPDRLLFRLIILFSHGDIH